MISLKKWKYTVFYSMLAWSISFKRKLPTMNIVRLSLVILLSNLWFTGPVAAFARIQAMKAPMLFMGAIQFPVTIAHIPTVRIYYRGNILTATPDDVSKQITFDVAGERSDTHFNLLITKHVSFNTFDANTIPYLHTQDDYKYYALSLVKKNSAARFGHKSKNHDPSYEWDIVEHALPADGRIPDSCIIILMDPTIVADLDQGNAIELPTVMIKTNVGGEAKLHKNAELIMIDALDSDTLHVRIDYATIQDRYPKTILAMAT
jgi:hypothetical protein